MYPFQRAVRSKPTVDFLEALVTNAISATVNLKLPTRDANWLVQAFELTATENLAYELWLFSSAVNLAGGFDDKFIGAWQFNAATAAVPASPGYPVSADPLFRYYIDGTGIPYTDLDAMTASGALAVPGNASLHVRLVNRSTASKTAGAPGALQLTVYAAPFGQQPA